MRVKVSHRLAVVRPDDPRAVRSRDAILAAARDLLRDHGPAAVTHQRVAERAGVGRATVYRHWARAEQLLLDAMAGSDLPYFKKPSTPVRPWLFRQLRAMADELAHPEAVTVAVTLMHGARWDEQLARQRDGATAAIVERVGAALELAFTTGELAERPIPADAAAHLVGPLVWRATMQVGRPTSDDFINRLLDGVGL
jgi:AcrR family transcriptional regulator